MAELVTGAERRIRWAGVLIGLGLFVQLLTFISIRPLAFVIFAVVGCPLVAAGIVFFLLYLYSWIIS